jgi:MSHA biogenesis protein MshQ
VQLAFDANGLATPNMLYADAGALGLTATYASTSGSDSGLTMTGSGNVIVGPKSFVFSAIATPQRAGLAALPVAPATRISGLGRERGRRLDGQFWPETTAQTVLLDRIFVAPTFSGAANPAVAGSLAFNNGNGSGTASNLSWAEAGTIQFTATMATYLGAAPPAVNGVIPPLPRAPATACNSSRTTSSRRCPAANPCLARRHCPARRAVHLCAAAVQAARHGAECRERDDAQLRRPRHGLDGPGGLARLRCRHGPDGLPPATPAGSRLSDGTAAQTTVTGFAPASFTTGVASSQIAYRFPGAYACRPVRSRWRRRPTCCPRHHPYAGATVTSAPSDAGTEARLTVLTGRIMVPNSYGSERLPIRLPVQVQYWNGSWLGNVSDSATQSPRPA